MSQREINRRRMLASICREAWRLIKVTKIESLSLAMKLAWAELRRHIKVFRSRVAGVTFENRQTLLRRLTAYKTKEVFLFLEREINPHDPNALRVMVTVHKGTACIGYVPRELAAVLSAAINRGDVVIPWFEAITGTFYQDSSLGCTFRYLVI